LDIIMNIRRDTLLTSILLTLVGPGCPLPAKTVGEESGANDGEGDGEGEDDSASADDDDGDDEAPTGSDGDDDGSDDGEWDDCAGRECGVFCYVCDPDDPECGLPGTFTVCTPAGTCEIWGEWDVDPCPGSGVETGVESTLTNIGGCVDTTVYATTPERDVALHLHVDGLIAEAEASGAPVVREYAADDPEIELELTAGADLLALTCTDAIGDPPTIDEQWRPRFWEDKGPGTVSITVEIVATEQGDVPLADVTLTGVNFGRVDEFDGLDPDIVLEQLVLEDVNVGLMPG
jgi:hypothetical protein